MSCPSVRSRCRSFFAARVNSFFVLLCLICRTVIGYGDSDWDCVIATSQPPSVSAQRQQQQQQQQQQHHNTHDKAHELQTLQLTHPVSPSIQQLPPITPRAEPVGAPQLQPQPLPQHPGQLESVRQSVHVDEITPTIVVDEPLQLQQQEQHQLAKADLELLVNTSSEELVEFDRLSTDLTLNDRIL